jgi:hypothetical protein
MKVTDKMVQVAACEYLGRQHDYNLPSGNITDMHRALEAATQAAWIKFDIDDKSTHPKNLQHVIVLYHTGTVGSDKWSVLKTWMFSGCKDCVLYWMPLPEYKGE